MQLERENMKTISIVRRLMFHVSENIQYMNQRFLTPITEMQHLELRLTEKNLDLNAVYRNQNPKKESDETINNNISLSEDFT